MPRVRAEVRREQLVDATVRVIAQDGVSGATIRRIAAEADAPLVAVNYCFKSKEDLLFAVYEKQVQTLQRDFWHSRKGAGLGRAAGALIRQLMDYYRSDEAWARCSMELYYWVLRQDKSLGSKAYDIHFAAVREALGNALRADDDPELIDPLARAIASWTDGLLMQWFAFPDEHRLAEGIDLACESLELLAAARRIR